MQGRDFRFSLAAQIVKKWIWKNYLMAWPHMFSGKEKKPSVVLEAIGSSELWIWHIFFGSPESLNDIKILDTSSTIADIMESNFLLVIRIRLTGGCLNCCIIWQMAYT